MLPATTRRVPEHTAAHVNQQIRRATEQRVGDCAAQGRAAIDRRLAQLHQEWDIERTLEANAAAISLLGVTLGAAVDRRWFVVPGVVAAFLLQHALQGWCPPLPVFRRLGIRTRSEIEAERYALKTLRGDLRELPTLAHGSLPLNAPELLAAMER